MEEVYDFLKKCGTFFIATLDNDQPRVRPFGALNMFEGKIYIETGKKKDVSSQMQINSKVEICALDGDKWLRIEATVVRDDRIEAKQSMLDANPVLKNMYSAEDDNTEVLYLSNVKARFYSFTEAPRVVEF